MAAKAPSPNWTPIAPWGYDQFGTAYTSEADRTRGENLKQWGKEFGTIPNTGPVPIESVSKYGPDQSDWTDEVRDTDYLWYLCATTKPMAFQQLLSGSVLETNQLINDSEWHFNYLNTRNVDIKLNYNGILKQYA
jgi:hypothetical protein